MSRPFQRLFAPSPPPAARQPLSHCLNFRGVATVVDEGRVAPYTQSPLRGDDDNVGLCRQSFAHAVRFESVGYRSDVRSQRVTADEHHEQPADTNQDRATGNR